jgi:hypothetical protein
MRSAQCRANGPALRRCWNGAPQWLRTAAQENLGDHDDGLGKNEKKKFGVRAMQNCDSATSVNQMMTPVHHSFGVDAEDCLSPVMPALVAGIHVFNVATLLRRGCPA